MPFATGFNIPPHLGPAIAEETITLLTSDRFPPALVHGDEIPSSHWLVAD